MTLNNNNNNNGSITHRTSVSRWKKTLSCLLWPVLVVTVVLSFSDTRWFSGRLYTETQSPHRVSEGGNNGNLRERGGSSPNAQGLPHFENLAVRRWRSQRDTFTAATLLVPMQRQSWRRVSPRSATTTGASDDDEAAAAERAHGRYFERVRECVSPSWCHKLRWGKFSLFHSVPLPLEVCSETFVLNADPCIVARATTLEASLKDSMSNTTQVSSRSPTGPIYETESTCSCEHHRPGVYHDVFLHVATPEPNFGISKFTPIVALTWVRLQTERSPGASLGLHGERVCERKGGGGSSSSSSDGDCERGGERRILTLIDKSNSLLHFQRCLGNFEVLSPLFHAASAVRASMMTLSANGTTGTRKRSEDYEAKAQCTAQSIPIGFFVTDPLSRVAGHALEKVLEALGQYMASDELLSHGDIRGSVQNNKVPWLLPSDANHAHAAHKGVHDDDKPRHGFDAFELFVVEITEALGIPLVRFPFDCTVHVERFVAPHYENGENGLCWRTRALEVLRPLASKASAALAPLLSSTSSSPRRVALIKFDYTVNASTSPDRAFRSSSRFTQLLRSHNVTLLNNTMKLLPRMHALNEAELVVTTWGSTFTTTLLLLRNRKSATATTRIPNVTATTVTTRSRRSTTTDDGDVREQSIVPTATTEQRQQRHSPLLLVVLIHPGYLQEARRIFRIHGLVKAKVWKVDITKRRADYRGNISWRTTFVDYDGGPNFCARFITTPTLRYVNDADLTDPCNP